MHVKFYLTPAGRSPVEEFLMQLPQESRADFFDAVTALELGKGLAMPVSRNLSGIHPGLHELRLRDRYGPIRFFYYFKKSEAIYLIHALRKKTQKIPQKEIEVVLKRLREI